jgi:alternate signal-mediated exported protein
MTARRDVLVLALLAFVIAALVGGSTYALWHRTATVPSGVVTTGDLQITLDGPSTWTETSKDVSPQHTVASNNSTADHLATPGDSFTLTQSFKPNLVGDNLAARLTVDWSTPPVLLPTGQVTAEYVVTNPLGVTTTPAPLGTAVTLPGASTNFTPADVAAWAGRPWTLTVTLTYIGPPLVVAPGGVATAPVTDLGAVTLDLQQVRDGQAFRP